jgi:histidinol-phosphate aminotransferase
LLQTISYLRPYPSQSNFILCRASESAAAELKQALARAGVLVRYFDKPGLQDCIRISVGRPEQTDILIRTLRDME